MRSRNSAVVMCEQLMRKTSAPACTSAVIISGVAVAGPSVAITFVLRIAPELLQHGVQSRRFLVSKGGLEPPRPFERQPLKLVRLPISPLRRGCGVSTYLVTTRAGFRVR